MLKIYQYDILLITGGESMKKTIVILMIFILIVGCNKTETKTTQSKNDVISHSSIIIHQFDDDLLAIIALVSADKESDLFTDFSELESVLSNDSNCTDIQFIDDPFYKVSIDTENKISYYRLWLMEGDSDKATQLLSLLEKTSFNITINNKAIRVKANELLYNENGSYEEGGIGAYPSIVQGVIYNDVHAYQFSNEYKMIIPTEYPLIPYNILSIELYDTLFDEEHFVASLTTGKGLSAASLLDGEKKLYMLYPLVTLDEGLQVAATFDMNSEKYKSMLSDLKEGKMVSFEKTNPIEIGCSYHQLNKNEAFVSCLALVDATMPYTIDWLSLDNVLEDNYKVDMDSIDKPFETLNMDSTGKSAFFKGYSIESTIDEAEELMKSLKKVKLDFEFYGDVLSKKISKTVINKKTIVHDIETVTFKEKVMKYDNNIYQSSFYPDIKFSLERFQDKLAVYETKEYISIYYKGKKDVELIHLTTKQGLSSSVCEVGCLYYSSIPLYETKDGIRVVNQGLYQLDFDDRDQDEILEIIDMYNAGELLLFR